MRQKILFLSVAAFARLAHAQNSQLYLGGAAAPPGAKTCVQVQIPGEKPSAFNCLNQELRNQALSAAHGLPTAPLGAGSPSNAVGTFNEQGLREQYGQNFGKSAEPYRPPPPVFGGGATTK